MTTAEIVQNVGGVLASGTVGAIIIAIANRWKTKAEADSGFADTYLKVKDSLNKDVDIISARFEKQIAGIVGGYEEQLKKKDIIINQQRTLIDDQNDRILVLEKKVHDLEVQVEAAKTLPKAVEEAREIMHHTVDVVADKINPEIYTDD